MFPGSKTHQYAVRETTLWEDILVDRNILFKDEKLEAQKLAIEEAKTRGFELEKSSTEKIQSIRGDLLDEFEDDFNKNDEEEQILQKFREARLNELKEQAKKETFGNVEILSRDEFMGKVKEGSKTRPIIIELFQTYLEKSQITSKCVEQLARENLTVKFVKMVSDQCIESWPDSKVPSIFVYQNGELLTQLIGFNECGNGNCDKLQQILAGLKLMPLPKIRTSTRYVGRNEMNDW